MFWYQELEPYMYVLNLGISSSAETFCDEMETLILLKLKISTLYFMTLHLEFNKN